jgi:hypothetical protein
VTQTTENLTSDDRFAEIWQDLSHNQRRFVVQMTECGTKKEAAEIIGVNPHTVYNWDDDIDEAIALLMANAKDSAVDMLTSALARAVMVKLAGLESDDERVKQDAASEVIDRVLGKATQKQQITGADGGPVEHRDVTEERTLKPHFFAQVIDELESLRAAGGDAGTARDAESVHSASSDGQASGLPGSDGP